MKKMQVFGLTGRSGSGKGAVADVFRQYGVPVIDSDEVAKEAVEIPACKEELSARFGADIYKNGKLDRPLLAARAFSSEEATKSLTAITHKYIVALLLEKLSKLEKQGRGYAVVDGSTIIDGPFMAHVDKLLVVDTTEKLRLARIMKRDGITESAAKQRLARQPSDAEFRKAADYVIPNSGTLEQLQTESKKALEKMEEWTIEQ